MFEVTQAGYHTTHEHSLGTTLNHVGHLGRVGHAGGTVVYGPPLECSPQAGSKHCERQLFRMIVRARCDGDRFVPRDLPVAARFGIAAVNPSVGQFVLSTWSIRRMPRFGCFTTSTRPRCGVMPCV